MWKTIPTRGAPFWQELASGRSAVPVRNASSSPHSNPNCRVFDGPGNFCGATTSQRQREHGGHGWYDGSSWWRRRAGSRRDASGAGVGRARRVGVRAVVAADEVVGFDFCVGRIGDGEAGIGHRIGDRNEVVKILVRKKEDLFENVVMPYSRLEVTMHGRSAVDGRSVAADMELEAGSVDRVQDGGSKRDVVMRCQSDVVTGGAPRLLSQRNPLTGAEYRRRRTISDLSKFGGNGPHHQGSFREFTHRAASETYLITRLAITLLKLLGIGTRWMGKFIRLSLYAVFLMPGFIQVGYFYYFDQRIHRSIVYGDQPRNRFDLYLPPDSDKPKPVVIFITGGAWVIGYKAWGSLLAQQLVERNIIVACIDYRNFPQGCISDMVSDVSTGIGYVYQNAETFGGDPNMVYLAGQSAGAHLAACALLMQAEKEINEDPAKLVWRASQMKAYLAISGGYNLIKLVEYFHIRGLYKSIMLRVMEGEKSLPIYSPEFIVKTPTFKKAVPLLPPITLFHGTGDYSIPHEASVAFAVALQSVGARVNTIFYPDKTHTDLFLQDPMRGGKDELLVDILAVVHANDEEAKAEDVKNAYSRRRLVPEFLLQLARRVSPF